MNDQPIEALLDEVDAYLAEATPGEWAVWDSCSWRRIGTKEPYADGNVICPINQLRDGHPDLLARREDLEFVVKAKRDLPRLSRELRQRIEREQEAMAILEPSMPESGLVDACKQLKQAYISEHDNAETADQIIADLRQQLEQRQRLPICSKCQQGYVCEYCGDPIGDYYAGLGVKRVEQQQQQSEKSK